MTAVSNDIAPAVGVSISESPDMGALGLSEGHLRDAMALVALEVLSSGWSLAYGGDLRPGGFTELLAELVGRYRGHPRHRSTIAVTDYLAWPVHVQMPPDELSGLSQELQSTVGLVFLSQDGERLARDQWLELPTREPDRQEWAAGLTAMRMAMRGDISARIILGGRVEGYKGVAPGIAEEAMLSLQAGQPVFLMGGFGGCTRDVAETMGLVERWGGSRGDWQGRACFREYSPDDLCNGLSLDENRVLARTPHIQEAVTLVSWGLHRISNGRDDDAQGVH